MADFIPYLVELTQLLCRLGDESERYRYALVRERNEWSVQRRHLSDPDDIDELANGRSIAEVYNRAIVWLQHNKTTL